MIQLSTLLWISIGIFGMVGFMRGWTKEVLVTAAIILALFTLRQFESLLIDPLTQGKQASKFYLQATILLGITFFGYQTPPDQFSRTGSSRVHAREGIQEGVLGTLVGAFNGYLLAGSLWWYMDNLEYPLSPHVLPVAPGSPSADIVDMLPLNWLLSGDGGLLSIIMVALFIFVIVAVV